MPRPLCALVRSAAAPARIARLLAAWLLLAGALQQAPAWAQVTPLPDVMPLPMAQLDGGISDPAALLAQRPALQEPLTASLAGESSWKPPPCKPPCVTDDYDCSRCAWHSQVLPHGLIYQSYMAGIKEPRLGSFWNNEQSAGTTIWDVALGGRAGLWRYGNDNPDWPEGWQLDLEGAAFPRVDPLGDSTPLISTDYRFGIPITYGNGQWQFKTGYYHISSHIGDEFLIDNPGFARINYVRDGVVFGVGYFWTEELRLYSELGVTAASGGAEPLELQFGFDWAPARNTGLRGGPFLALNGYLREEVDFGGNVVVQFGWLWRRYARGPSARIGGQYFYGKSDQFQFFDQTESRMGWGIWYDF